MLSSLLSRIVKQLGGAAHSDIEPASDKFSISATDQQFFHEQGYLILPKLFSPESVRDLNVRLDELWEGRADQKDVAIDVFFEMENEARIYFRKATLEQRKFPYKISDLHLVDRVVREACTDPKIMSALGSFLGSNPIVCNSLFFEWGSQQYPHFDTFFMPSKTRNMMAASWLSLDQVTERNGPLYYYPKSHLIEPYTFSHGKTTAIFSELKTGAADHIQSIIEHHGLRKEYFMASPGDVLIWHAQLLHGGGEITSSEESRRSLVTHYWTELDIPDASERIDFGHGRLILNKPHQYVVDEEVLSEVDAFLLNVAATPEQLRQIPEQFDPRLYLARNQDVLKAGESPWQHYLNHGRREGRIW